MKLNAKTIVKRLIARILRTLQSQRWYRKVGQAFVRHHVRIIALPERLVEVATPPVRIYVFTAQWGSNQLGRVALSTLQPGFPSEIPFWIFALQVRTALRGYGIAEKLCRVILTAAAEQGATQVGLLVDANNTPAVQLYKKLGFTIVTDSPFPAEWSARLRLDRQYYLMIYPISSPIAAG